MQCSGNQESPAFRHGECQKGKIKTGDVDYIEAYIEAEELGDIGLRLNQRVYLWAAGFLLACEQLEIIKLVD